MRLHVSVEEIARRPFLVLRVTLYRALIEEHEKRRVRGAFQQYVSPEVVRRLLDDPKLVESRKTAEAQIAPRSPEPAINYPAEPQKRRLCPGLEFLPRVVARQLDWEIAPRARGSKHHWATQESRWLQGNTLR